MSSELAMRVEVSILKSSLIASVLMALIIGCCTAPVMAQGVTTGFAIHVGFVYTNFALYNMQVTLNDQTGRIIGTGMSPDGSEIIIGVRTETPIYLVTVRASGFASFGSYPYPYSYWFYPIGVSNPYWPLSGISTTIVQTTGGDYWVTVLMAKS
jgi:hypothetical protein